MWEYFLRFTVREIEAQNLEIVYSAVEPGLHLRDSVTADNKYHLGFKF